MQTKMKNPNGVIRILENYYKRIQQLYYQTYESFKNFHLILYFLFKRLCYKILKF